MQANLRTLELIAAILEWVYAEKLQNGDINAEDPTETVSVGTILQTPINPIFNPRYALTDTGKAAELLRDLVPTTCPPKEWHASKANELDELEAVLKSMPRHRARPQAHGKIAGDATLLQLDGPKRKNLDGAETPITSPPAKRQPGSTPADTLVLKAAIIRRPGGPRPPSSAHKEHKKSENRQPSDIKRIISGIATPAGISPKKRANGESATAAARVNKANDAYIARMRKANHGSKTHLKA